MEYARIMSKSNQSIINDKMTFTKWMLGKISTDRCFKAFLKNNHRDEYFPGLEYDRDEFEAYLGTLGYERMVNDGHKTRTKDTKI